MRLLCGESVVAYLHSAKMGQFCTLCSSSRNPQGVRCWDMTWFEVRLGLGRCRAVTADWTERARNEKV